MILESNEVVATSGFLSQVGPPQILWVWALDMIIVMIASGAYSLFVDRTRRDRLAQALCVGFCVAYLCLYALFQTGTPGIITYPLLTILNDQHWLLFPMLIWSLANDMFTISEAKRLFALLGVSALLGGIAGNGITTLSARFLSSSSTGSTHLLLLNAGLLAAMALGLRLSLRRIQITARQSRAGEKVLDTLREGIAFVQQVPSYRYLTLAMILLGIGLNVVEYQMVASAAGAYTQVTGLETFFATVRTIRIVLMFVVQGLLSGWLLKQLEFKRIFIIMPVALLCGLLLGMAVPTLVGAVIAQVLTRTTLEGIDEPSRRAFLGLVPDERRGRVSAFVEGYLYPLGSIVSCGMTGLFLTAAHHNLLDPVLARALYMGVGCICAIVALISIFRFRAHYDTSMLNWRLKRRQRSSVISKLEF
jgi:AAA family ATP:ADP antiporter